MRRDGECKGTVTSGTNAGTGRDRTEELTLRSEEKYRECQRLLRETHFFWMRDRVPKTQFESSTTSVEVRAGIRRHRVRVVSPETPPAGFTRLTAFVDGLATEAKGGAKK